MDAELSKIVGLTMDKVDEAFDSRLCATFFGFVAEGIDSARSIELTAEALGISLEDVKHELKERGYEKYID